MLDVADKKASLSNVSNPDKANYRDGLSAVEWGFPHLPEGAGARGTRQRRHCGGGGGEDDQHEDDHHDFGATPDPEIARLVLELDRSIMRRRRAAALRQIVQGQPVPPPMQVPMKHNRIELLVLTALVSIYGPSLFGADFTPVLD
ncbi:hypothetical protein AWB79_05040 [Caballeronia hypogeia]|uniref:Uncharacterized protein n=1 Tax=Caballeronia hypogeia TaxID=1777140 RepID=A0A158CAU4_9BURK|nr:hypothetical protein AWB79_05040 [Caballeronia hypogeia]